MRTASTFGLALILAPAVVQAQSGVAYYDHAVRYAFEVPEGMRGSGEVPTERYARMALHFDASVSRMRQVLSDEEAAEAGGMSRRAMNVVDRFRRNSAERSDHERLDGTWVHFRDARMVQTVELLGRRFRIEEPRPSLAWRLTGEQSRFLDYTVQKAVAERDGSTIEAWFTTEVPVQAGPGVFGGLPGLILVVSVDRGAEIYSATDVVTGPVTAGELTPPEDGDPVTREEYEAVVAEKMEEIRVRSSRRRGRPGGSQEQPG